MFSSINFDNDGAVVCSFTWRKVSGRDSNMANVNPGVGIDLFVAPYRRD